MNTLKKVLLMITCIAAMPFIAQAADSSGTTPKPEMNRAHKLDTMRYSISGALVVTSKELSGVTEIRIYDASSMRFLRKFLIPGYHDQFAVLPDDSGLCYTYNRALHRIDFAAGNDTVITTADTIDKRCAAFSPDGKKIAAIGNREAYIVSFPEGRILSRFHYESGDYKLEVTFSHDGTMIAMGGPSSNGNVDLYSITQAKTIKLGGFFSGHKGQIDGLCFSDDDTLLASCGGWGDQKVTVWECIAGKEKASFKTDVRAGFSAVFIKNINEPVQLVTGDRTHCRFDIAGEKIIEEKKFYADSSLDDVTAFSPDGTVFAFQPGWIGVPQLYRSSDLTAVYQGNAVSLGAVEECAFTSDGAYLYYAKKEGVFRINTVTGEQIKINGIDSASASGSYAFLPDKSLVAYDTYRSTYLYDVAQNKIIFDTNKSLSHISISGDGQYIFGASLDQSTNTLTATRVSVKSGEKKQMSCSCAGFRIDGKQISDDGRYAAYITTIGTAYVFDFQKNVWSALDMYGAAIRISSGDKTLFTDQTFIRSVPVAIYNDWSSTALAVDFAAGKTTSLPLSGTRCNYYLPDRSKVLIGSEDGSMQLYDAVSFNNLGMAAAGAGGFGAIHPDGRYFGSSPAILSLFHWVVGNEAIALSDFSPQFFTPGILNEIFTGKAAAGASKKEKPAVSVKRQLMGKVFHIEGNNVIVASTQSGSLVRGGRLFIMPDEGGTVELTISMPMHTSAKCAIKDASKKKMIRKGMPVFKE